MIKKLDQGRSGHDASISDALHAENVGFDSEKIRSHRAHGQKLEQQWLEATKRCLLKLCGSQNSYADFAMAVWLLEVGATAGADVMAPYVHAEVCPPLEQVFITRPYPNPKHCFNYRLRLYDSEGHRRYLSSRLNESVWGGARDGDETNQNLTVSS